MSVEAMAWALRYDLTGKLSAEHRLVLVVLADHADVEGANAWPSRARIATRLGTTERSVSRALAALERQGLIRRGNQALTKHLPADRRPVVWQLRLGSRAPEATPVQEALVATPERGDSTVTPDTSVTPSRGDSTVPNGVTALSPKPTTEPPTPPVAPPGPIYARPPCEHGTPGGLDLHPKTQKPRCPLCRAAS